MNKVLVRVYITVQNIFCNRIIYLPFRTEMHVCCLSAKLVLKALLLYVWRFALFYAVQLCEIVKNNSVLKWWYTSYLCSQRELYIYFYSICWLPSHCSYLFPWTFFHIQVFCLKLKGWRHFLLKRQTCKRCSTSLFGWREIGSHFYTNSVFMAPKCVNFLFIFSNWKKNEKHMFFLLFFSKWFSLKILSAAFKLFFLTKRCQNSESAKQVSLL